jgi:hypothetical protein
MQKQLDPSGEKFLPVAEVLNQINAPLQDGPITPSNADLGHRIVMRSSLPTVALAKANKGAPASKSTTEVRNESMALFDASSEVDVKERHLIGATKFNMARAREDMAFAEAMSQAVAAQLAYGSIATNASGFDGLATRLSAINKPTPGNNGSQVWSMGANGGDGSSIYIVDWGEMACHWIYPEDSGTGGLAVIDHGDNVRVTDVDGNGFYAAVTQYLWSIGFAVEDPRRIARLANIDVSDANLGGLATQGLLINTLIKMLSRMPNPIGFNRVMYAHTDVISAFELQILGKTAPLYLTMDQYLGQMIPHFRNIPLRRLDQLSISEGTVS